MCWEKKDATPKEICHLPEDADTLGIDWLLLSLDRKKILFVAATVGKGWKNRLISCDRKTGQQETLLEGDVWDADRPGWATESKLVISFSSAAKGYWIEEVDVATRKRRVVWENPPGNVTLSPDGKRLCVTVGDVRDPKRSLVIYSYPELEVVKRIPIKDLFPEDSMLTVCYVGPMSLVVYCERDPYELLTMGTFLVDLESAPASKRMLLRGELLGMHWLPMVPNWAPGK